MCRGDALLQADGQVVGSAGPGIGVVHHQIMGVISSGMWGEFDGAGTKHGNLMRWSTVFLSSEPMSSHKLEAHDVYMKSWV